MPGARYTLRMGAEAQRGVSGRAAPFGKCGLAEQREIEVCLGALQDCFSRLNREQVPHPRVVWVGEVEERVQ